MEGSIGSRLFETVGGGIHGLSSGGEGASGQHFHLLGVSDFGVGVNDFSSGILELLGEGSKLKNLAFDKGISQLLYGSVDDELVGLSGLKDALPKRMEGGLRTITRSCSQLDREHRMSFTHGEVGAWAAIVEYESDVFGFTLVVIGVVDGRHDTKSSVGPVFDERGSRVHVTCRVIDHGLVHASDNNGGSGRPNAMRQ